MKNRNAVYKARSRGRGHGKTEGAAKAKKGYGFWRSKEKYVTVAAAGIITAAAKKEIGSGYMTADERRRKAIEGHYKAYREYKKLDTVREHMRVEMSGDTLIEIHRYYGERKGERVLRVTREEEEGAEVSAEVAAYEQAADQLENMIKSRRESLEARQQAARKAAV